jgi:hypothetical protein
MEVTIESGVRGDVKTCLLTPCYNSDFLTNETNFYTFQYSLVNLLHFPLQTLRAHNISLMELRRLSEEHLETIGIPLGVRVRLLEESRKLEPIDVVS